MNSHSYNIHMGERIFFRNLLRAYEPGWFGKYTFDFMFLMVNSKSPAPFFRKEVSTLQLSPFITTHLKSFFIKDEWKVYLSLVLNHACTPPERLFYNPRNTWGIEIKLEPSQ